MNCASVRDLLPERAAGLLDPARAAAVDGHLAGCPECAADLRAVSAVAAARAEVPSGLADRIRAAVREDRAGAGAASAPRARPSPRAWPSGVRWRSASLAAAAVAGVAVAAAVWLRAGGPGEGGGPDDALLAALESAPSVWLAGDGMVAGAPVLDDLSDLSDDDLRSLLEELEG